MSQNDTNTTNETTELHALVHGRVQAVGFRDFVTRKALPLGLRGYVRNTDDGSVEVVAQGTRLTLERLLIQLRQGPSAAQVSEVQATWQEPIEHFSGFHIRW